MPVILNADYSEADYLFDVQPICGEDFCDACGDCLYCYGDEQCTQEFCHQWVVYADQVDEFLAKHPEASLPRMTDG